MGPTTHIESCCESVKTFQTDCGALPGSKTQSKKAVGRGGITREEETTLTDEERAQKCWQSAADAALKEFADSMQKDADDWNAARCSTQRSDYCPKTILLTEYNPLLCQNAAKRLKQGCGAEATVGPVHNALHTALFVLEDIKSSEVHSTVAHNDVIMLGGHYCRGIEQLLLQMLKAREHACQVSNALSPMASAACIETPNRLISAGPGCHRNTI